MLYRIFKWLFQLTVSGYFRSIYVSGLESVPQNGPVIFTANHTSAFMDPILIAVKINRVLYFLARGDVFKNKLIALLLRKFNMIPVYNPETEPGEVHKNKGVFQKCFDHLKTGNTLMIFPEGTSRTERRLRPIKTGTARIALGAEEQNDFNLGVTIIPIGLNYSNPHHFRSDVYVNFGTPIQVSDYKTQYENDPVKTVKTLTKDLKSALESRVVVIEDERLDKIIKQIEILYRSKLRDESKGEAKAEQDFYLSKDIVKAVEFHTKNNPEEIEEFEKKIDAYLRILKRLKIRDTQIRTSRISLNLLWRTLYFVFGFPLFLYGFLANYIPYKMAGQASKFGTVREDFVGSIKIAAGMFFFLITYGVQAAILASFVKWYWVLLFVISLYPAGLFTVSYLKNYYQFRGSLKYVQLFMRKSDLIAGLKNTRQELVAQLEDGKERYLKHL